jgi:hypothetical protein
VIVNFGVGTADEKARANRCELHSDFHSVGAYLYTVILYLSDGGGTGDEAASGTVTEGVETASMGTGGTGRGGKEAEGDFAGGETLFVDGVDEVNVVDGEGGVSGEDDGDTTSRHHQTSTYTKGLLVEPRLGRVVLFTGGLENLHCRMPITKGRRIALQAWYQCDDDSERVK